MQNDNERPVAVPSSYGAAGAGPGVGEGPQQGPYPSADAPTPKNDAHDTPEESA